MEIFFWIVANFYRSNIFIILQFVTSDSNYNNGLSVITGAPPTLHTTTLTPTTLRNIEQVRIENGINEFQI